MKMAPRHRVETREEAAVALLRRLRAWDMFNPPDASVCADAPYWVAEIDKVLEERAES